MDKYSPLFDLSKYIDDPEICFSINGDLEGQAYYLPESILTRIICIGSAYQLHYVPMINIFGNLKLNKTQIYPLIEELVFIRSVVNDEVINYFIPPLIKLLEKIIRHQNDNELWIMGN